MHKYNSIPADAIKINYTNKDFDVLFVISESSFFTSVAIGNLLPRTEFFKP